MMMVMKTMAVIQWASYQSLWNPPIKINWVETLVDGDGTWEDFLRSFMGRVSARAMSNTG